MGEAFIDAHHGRLLDEQLVADGPAIDTISGPRNANPIANDPWSVRLKTLMATSSCAFGTTRGIIEPSAGVSATLMRLTPRLSARTSAMFIPASASPAVNAVRMRFGTMSADTNFRYDASLAGYIYNLKTTGLTTGTWALSFTTSGDGLTHTVRFDVR